MQTIKILLCTLFSLAFQIGLAQSIEWSKKANPYNLTLNSVAFSANGQKILTGTNCHPASIRMYVTDTGALEWDHVVDSSFLCIMGVSFSSNSNYLAAIEEFGNVFIFDNTGPTPIFRDTINTGTLYGFSSAISPLNDKLVVGCSDGKMQLYNLNTGALIKEINAHISWVTTVTFSPDGNYIISGGSDNKIKIWDTAGTLINTCSGHIGHITQVKVSPDNQHIVSSSKDDNIKIWQLPSGSLVRTMSDHQADVTGIDISTDGSKIVSSSYDKSCKIWSFNGDLLSTFGIPDSGLYTCVAWSPSGKYIATGNTSSDLSLWRVPETLSIPEYNFDGVQIYPNPAQDYLYIESPANVHGSIAILDQYGRVVESNINLNSKLDIAEWNSGIYYIHMYLDGNAYVVRKVVVSR